YRRIVGGNLPTPDLARTHIAQLVHAGWASFHWILSMVAFAKPEVLETVTSVFEHFQQLTGGDKGAAASLTSAYAVLSERATKPKQAQDPDRMLDVRETAERLGVSESTVRNLDRCGKLPASKIGKGRGVLRFSPALVDTFQKASAGNPLPMRSSRLAR